MIEMKLKKEMINKLNEIVFEVGDFHTIAMDPHTSILFGNFNKKDFRTIRVMNNKEEDFFLEFDIMEDSLLIKNNREQFTENTLSLLITKVVNLVVE